MGTDGAVFLAVGLRADILLRSPHVTQDDLLDWRYLETGNVWDHGVVRRMPGGLQMMAFGDHQADDAETDWSRFLVGIRLWQAEKRGPMDGATPISADAIRRAHQAVEMGLFHLDIVDPPKPRLLLCTQYSG